MAITTRSTRFRKYGKKMRGLRRRAPRRPNRVYRPMRPSNVHYFTRFAHTSTTLSMNALGQVLSGIQCNGISDCTTGTSAGGISMPSHTEFTNLFDKYKLLSFTVEFIPKYDSNNIGGQYNLPVIYYKYDSDDSTAPATISELMECAKVRRWVLNRPLKLHCKYPCVAASLYNGLTTAYGVKRSPWIDLAYPAVPHYGIKFVGIGSPSTNYQIDIRITWRFACMNSR